MSRKKYSQVLNLPVIDVQEGRLLGKVRSLLIDSREARVALWEIKGSGPGKEGSSWLPHERVRRIGPDALIVEGAGALEEALPEVPGGAAALAGKKVVSEAGRVVGTIRDFTFQEEGVLQALYLKTGMGDLLLKGDRPLPASSLKRVGEDYVVIQEAVAEELLEQAGETPLSQIREKGKEFSHSLEVRAIDFALGKPVNRDIHGPDGSLIIQKGEEVTPESIDAARNQGRLPQVLVAAGVGELIEALDVPREKLDAGSRKLLEFWERLKSRAAAGEEDPAEKEAGRRQRTEVREEDEEGEIVGAEGMDAGGFGAEEDAEKKPAGEERDLEDFLDEIQTFSRSTARKLEKTSYSTMRRYLRGRYASERVVGPGGHVLVEGEQLIDEEVISRAEDLGLLSHLFTRVVKEDVQGRLEHLRDALTGFFDGK